MKYLSIAVLSIAASLAFGTHTHAATPPDSCFAFNAGLGRITDYYNNEANNVANPACPRNVDIPSTIGGTPVTNVGTNAFFNNQLTAITIPSSVTSIGSYSFSYNQLSSLTIPSSVLTISAGAFYENRLTTVSIPSSVTSIGDSAFYNSRLTTVTIPNGAAVFQHNSFRGNPISSMTIGATTYTEQTPTTEPACFQLSDQTIVTYRQASPVVARDNGVLCGRDVTIPSSITTIGDSAFRYSQLTSVTIPNSVVSVGDFSFSDNQLTSITIPNSVTSIGRSGFRANQLSAVSVPSSVTSIGPSAFRANQLTDITISSGVASIGHDAFVNNRLTDVVVPSSVVSIGHGAFALQSHWGADLATGANGAPDHYSDDPAVVQEAYDSIWYVRLYTEDLANPSDFKDNILDEDWWDGTDGNEDGINNSLGGHLVNPASAELQYVNQANSRLQTTQTFTGQLSGDTYLTNYFVSQGPTVPIPADPENPTPTEQAALDEALSVYYRIGDSITINPPAIDGYTTPEPQTFVLSAADNTFSYVYAAADSPDSGGPATSVSDEDELADTGMPVLAILAIGGAASFVGATVMLRRF